MKKTEKTPLVQELIKRRVTPDNAYRIVYKSKGVAATKLCEVLAELLELKARDKKP